MYIGQLMTTIKHSSTSHLLPKCKNAQNLEGTAEEMNKLLAKHSVDINQKKNYVDINQKNILLTLIRKIFS